MSMYGLENLTGEQLISLHGLQREDLRLTIGEEILRRLEAKKVPIPPPPQAITDMSALVKKVWVKKRSEKEVTNTTPKKSSMSELTRKKLSRKMKAVWAKKRAEK